jgi:LacI family transcriptional regulator
MRDLQVLLTLGWYHPKLHRGVARYAGEHRWHLDFSFTRSMMAPRSWQGNGIVMQHLRGRGHCSVDALVRRTGVPAVKIGHHVRNDDAAIGRLAATHFLDRGFRHFAYATDRGGGSPRREAFQAALAESGRDCRVIAFRPAVASWPLRKAEWAAQLRKLPRPLALFAVTDEIAIEVVEAALADGFRVPDDIAVLGVRNDDLVCTSLQLGLSSIDNDLEAVGYQAAALLDAHITAGEPLPESPRLVPPVGVVERQSTDVVAAEHPGVARAIRFIRRRFREPLAFADIVADSGMSQRGLYKAFHQALGCSIHERVIRERLKLAKQLLRETDLAVEAVAWQAGFGESRTMFMHFRRDTGVAPREWRKTLRRQA